MDQTEKVTLFKGINLLSNLERMTLLINNQQYNNANSAFER
jgi:hypothetical protein